MVGDDVADGFVVVPVIVDACACGSSARSQKNCIGRATSTAGREQHRKRCSTAGRSRAARATTTAAWEAEAAPAASAFGNCREKRGAVGGSESDGDDDSGGEGLGDGHGGVGPLHHVLRAISGRNPCPRRRQHARASMCPLALRSARLPSAAGFTNPPNFFFWALRSARLSQDAERFISLGPQPPLHLSLQPSNRQPGRFHGHNPIAWVELRRTAVLAQAVPPLTSQLSSGGVGGGTKSKK